MLVDRLTSGLIAAMKVYRLVDKKSERQTAPSGGWPFPMIS
jgi:hypothetical protein